jgi:hypothetical protein
MLWGEPRGKDRRRASLPDFPALGRTAPANVGLDPEQPRDPFQRLAQGSCLHWRAQGVERRHNEQRAGVGLAGRPTLLSAPSAQAPPEGRPPP